ncbi:MAG: VCBS repeat-containing protein [Polaribacter sp.]
MILHFNKALLLISLLFIGMFSSCENKSTDTQLFSLLPSEKTGVIFNNNIKDDKEKNILLYANFYGGAGVGVGDFNNDGLQDIYFAGNIVADKLYLNQGDFKFKDYTDSAGIINDGSWSTGVIVADVNNDGFLDIYVTKELYDHQPELRKNKLYINQGDATFIEMAEKFGVANSERTRHATFLDYDKDGFLDLFILNQPPNPGSYSEYSGTELLLPKYASILYRNIAGKKFIKTTKMAGLHRASFPNAVSASDLNNDGWTDLYVANDFYAPDFIYLNNQDGTFTNVADKALNHMSYYSMGVDVSDINNDGFLDVFVVDMVAEDNFRSKSNMSGMNPAVFWKVVNDGGHYQYMYNTFHLNNGNNTFSDIAQLANIEATDWSWSNLIADFDNDGKKDIYITNGLLRDIRNTDASKKVGDFVVESAKKWTKENPNGGEVSIWDILDLEKTLAILPSEKLANYTYKNNGQYHFENVSSSWGLDKKSFSNGSAYADLDNDGDLDLIVNNINDEAFIYRNNANNNYLRIALKSKNNAPIFGTRVLIKNDTLQQVFETTNVRGIYSTSENIAHFGLNDSKKVDEIRITWPNNSVTILKNVKANQKMEVYLEDGKIMEDRFDKEIQPLFSDISSSSRIDFKHTENEFDDYQQQLLLPHKLSQFGPALAIADVNNDGNEDVFMGAATGFPSKLFLQDSNGQFKLSPNPAFELDKNYEDVDAVFFDIDNDGDQDLYVVSGGNAYKKEHPNYKDRVYLNNGKGNFTRSKKSIESFNDSGSVVVPADFDNDGDIDLFVGNRHIPHQYPLPASSRLLENRNGKLIDISKTNAKDLNAIGLVTDAIWTDYDSDNDVDLMIVGEWMGITLLKNEKGNFTKQSIADFENTKGWWFSIEQGDFDKDGDMDYIAGNLGLNYKYKTSIDKPFDIYYKDFDGNGKDDIVLGYYNNEKHYPLRGFSCSANQVPRLKKTIKKYDAFASMELTDVYGKENLSDAFYLKTDTFASSFIENLGNGKFAIKALPVEAQFSNINDFLIDDLNKDGNLDVLLAGNLFVSEVETPRNDAGTGLVLLGNGENDFKVMSAKESGFFTNGDVKKIKMLSNANEKLIFVANNNDFLQVFKLHQK